MSWELHQCSTSEKMQIKQEKRQKVVLKQMVPYSAHTSTAHEELKHKVETTGKKEALKANVTDAQLSQVLSGFSVHMLIIS